MNKIIKNINTKNIAIICVVGVCLLVIAMPSKENKNEDIKQKNILDRVEMKSDSYKDESESNIEYIKEQEDRLQRILESMRYVECAKVMITLKASKEEVVLKNNPYVKEENELDEVYESDEETVLIEDSEGNARPYILKEINPQIEGIVVVVDSNVDNIEQEINDVVLALFDIPIHKIKVMNMK